MQLGVETNFTLEPPMLLARADEDRVVGLMSAFDAVDGSSTGT